MRAGTRTLGLVALFVCCAALFAYVFVRPPAITAGGIDFEAFYCGARILSDRADPYHYEPLRTCEHDNRHWSAQGSVVWAPLPPYALAVLVPIARLPYPQAAVLWFLMLLASAFVIIWSLVTLTGLRLTIVGTSITLAVLLQGIPTGALAPIPLALLCAAAVALTRAKWSVATVLLALACIEPHVAGPALLATGILVREMRVRAIVAACAIAALSLAAGGPTLNQEYFLHVLPGHAAFELGSITQFGLSSMLHNFGLPDRAALAIGSAAIRAVRNRRHLAGCIIFARSLVGSTLFVPIALAVTGGTYIHVTQVAAALPLAFVAVSRKQSKIGWAGVVLLSLPWNLLNASAVSIGNLPAFAEVISATLAGRSAPGELGYLANALIYAGIACTYWSAFVIVPRFSRLRY